MISVPGKFLILLTMAFLPANSPAQTLKATPTEDLVFGNVANESGEAVKGEILFFDSQTKELAAKAALDEKGNYQILLPKNRSYFFEFHNGLFVHSFRETANHFETSKDAILSNLELSFTVLQRSLGAALELKGLNFEPHIAELNESGKAALDFFAAWLIANPGIKVQAAGHACDDPDDALNKDLSKRRAEVAFAYLTITKNISADRVLKFGYGSNRPLTGFEKFAAENRRVSFIVSENNNP